MESESPGTAPAKGPVTGAQDITLMKKRKIIEQQPTGDNRST